MDHKENCSALTNILLKHRGSYLPVLPIDFTDQSLLLRLDFSESNKELLELDFSSSRALERYVVSKLTAGAEVHLGWGGYGEERVWYQRSTHFSGEEPRTVHLGIDLWCPAGTPVFAPLAGKIHSFKDNNNFGDYGPTVILEHVLDGVKFYTLYGHLSRESLAGKSSGEPVAAGRQIGAIGTSEVNGDWPPHLHLQIIADMLGWQGDFPGVSSRSEAGRYLALCPDPNLILEIAE